MNRCKLCGELVLDSQRAEHWKKKHEGSDIGSFFTFVSDALTDKEKQLLADRGIHRGRD